MIIVPIKVADAPKPRACAVPSTMAFSIAAVAVGTQWTERRRQGVLMIPCEDDYEFYFTLQREVDLVFSIASTTVSAHVSYSMWCPDTTISHYFT